MRLDSDTLNLNLANKFTFITLILFFFSLNQNDVNMENVIESINKLKVNLTYYINIIFKYHTTYLFVFHRMKSILKKKLNTKTLSISWSKKTPKLSY